MASDRLATIPVAEIVFRTDVRNRDIDELAVDSLVESIEACGLNTPIRVRPASRIVGGQFADKWELISGHHRLAAVKRLGWNEIDAKIDQMADDPAEMAMIDENLKRKDLEPNELAYYTARRKALYERLFTSTAKPGPKTNYRNNCDNSEKEPERFTSATAKASDRSERSIQMMAAIGKKLGDAVLELSGTTLDTVTELDALAKLAPDERTPIMAAAKAGEHVSAKATLSAKRSGGSADPQSAVDAEEQRFWKYWASLSSEARRRILPQMLAMAPAA